MGLTQQALALATGLTRSRIGLIEPGYVLPTPHELQLLAQSLGQDPSRLYPAPVIKVIQRYQ